MIFRSVVTKLWMSIVLLLVTVLLILGVFLGQKFQDFYFDMQADNLLNKGIVIAQGITRGQDEASIEALAQAYSVEAKATIVIADPTGLIRMCTKMGMGRGAMLRLTPDEIKYIQKGEVLIKKGSNPHFEQEVLWVAVPVTYAGQVHKAVLLYAPLQPMTEAANEIRTLIITGAGGAIILATILALFLSKTISRPLLAINRAAGQMVKGDFREKVKVTTQDEIGLLGQTLNVLSAELDTTLRDLSTEKNQLSNILASMTDGVVSFSPEGRIIMINPPARELIGTTEGEIIGKLLEECCPIPEIKDVLQSVLNEGSVQVLEVKLHDRVLSVRMAPLREQNGDVRGAVAVVQDVTKERKLENMRRDFVANVSHELRTPITLIKGYGEAILEGIGDDRETREEMVGIMVDESGRMQRLVNELLDLAQLESGSFRLKMEPVNLPMVLERTIRKFTTLAKEKDVHVELVTDQDLPSIKGDEDRLEQVFTNLLDNALRHSDSGGRVEVSVQREAEQLRIRIKDTGKGIPSEEIPFIFDRFYKVEKSRNRKNAGTGLGLAIAKTIITAHGGRISLESQVGQGTTFSILL